MKLDGPNIRQMNWTVTLNQCFANRETMSFGPFVFGNAVWTWFQEQHHYDEHLLDEQLVELVGARSCVWKDSMERQALELAG